MRKAILGVVIAVGVIILIVVVAGIYAVLNLNGLIQKNRALILSKASDAIGRKVDVQSIHASLGWGVVADLQGVTIADDPKFSDKPFVQAADIYARVALIPLLSHQVDVEQLSLKEPVVRIIRDRAGALNVSTIARKPATGQPAAPPPGAPAQGAPLKGAPLTAAPPKEQKPSGAGALAGVSVSSLAIENGTISYQEAGAQPMSISSVNLDMENLGLTSPVSVRLSLAALAAHKNISLSGTVGPLMKNGMIDTTAIPLALDLGVGPVTMAELKSVPQLADALPKAVSITNPLSADVKLSGNTQALGFNLASDLTGNEVVYTGVLQKAAGVPLRMAALGSRKAEGLESRLEIQKATLTLGDLNLEAGQIQFGPGTLSARLNSNRFDLASLGKMLVALSKYNASGKAELHALVKVANKKPEVDGVLTLASVTLVPPGKPAVLRNLSGDLKMAGKSAVLGPLTFDLGSGHGRMEAYAQSLEPISATYSFSANVVKPAELSTTPNPEMAGDHLDQLAVKGTLRGSTSAPQVTAQVTSPSGMLHNAAYNNLAVDAAYGQQRVTISSLKLGVFDGTVDGNARATLGSDPMFDLALNLTSIGLGRALDSQKLKAAQMVRGQLTGQVRVAGHGSTFDQIKPTLNGNGRMSVANAKLKGVNVVADAMRKVRGVPGIDMLVSPAIIARHPELFNSPDTDLRQLSLSFTIQGPRITSHDILAAAQDYSLKGDGWFDLNKNIDMQARVLLTQQFSRELIAERKNIAYLTNRQDQVDIPVRISGQLPKPSVSPDMQDIAQRAAGHLVEKQAGKALNKFLGKKAGGLIPGFGGGTSPAPAPGGANPPPSNPLAPFQKLFH